MPSTVCGLFLQRRATLSYNTTRADDRQCVMRFNAATIVLAHAWAFNVHATPVDTTIAWDGHDPVDTAAIEPAFSVEVMEVKELLSTAMLNDIDEPIGNDDPAYLSHDISDMHVDSLDQDRETASISHEVALPSSGYNNYYYLALVPLGMVGFTILQGWRTWQKERRLERRAAWQGRPSEVATW